jgi:hypothetical protein
VALIATALSGDAATVYLRLARCPQPYLVLKRYLGDRDRLLDALDELLAGDYIERSRIGRDSYFQVKE